MTKAVNDWDALQEEGSDMSLNEYAQQMEIERGIPQSTLKKRCRADKKKRVALDAHAGRPSLLTKKEADIVTDLVIRHDRGNNGVNKKEIAEKIVAMKPSLSMKQAGDAFHRTVHPKNRDRLTGVISAQSTTTLRCQVGIEKLFAFDNIITSAKDQMALLNKPDGTGVNWEVRAPPKTSPSPSSRTASSSG